MKKKKLTELALQITTWHNNTIWTRHKKIRVRVGKNSVCWNPHNRIKKWAGFLSIWWTRNQPIITSLKFVYHLGLSDGGLLDELIRSLYGFVFRINFLWWTNYESFLVLYFLIDLIYDDILLNFFGMNLNCMIKFFPIFPSYFW